MLADAFLSDGNFEHVERGEHASPRAVGGKAVKAGNGGEEDEVVTAILTSLSTEIIERIKTRKGMSFFLLKFMFLDPLQCLC